MQVIGLPTTKPFRAPAIIDHLSTAVVGPRSAADRFPHGFDRIDISILRWIAASGVAHRRHPRVN